jgi:uncharacterized Fe-S center protein
VVDPAAIDDACVDTVQADNVVGCKKGVEDQADYSGDAWYALE